VCSSDLGNLLDIYTTVTKGVEAKGMQAWGKILPPDELNGVVL
jgi:mono/diheme cytochrome c family protein